MHTEHLQNVQPVRVVAGWLVAIAVTSAAVFGLIVLGLMGGDDSARDGVWAVAAVALGFLVGGWFTGFRTLEAPILHGTALGLTSLVAWALINLAALPFGMAEWTGLTPTGTLVVLLTQIIAAVAGCWTGTRWARERMSELAGSPAPGLRGREEV